jgi:hypothetical protein
MATQKTYQINIDVESKTLGQLEDQLANVNEELKDVDRNSEAFKNLSKQAQVLNAEIEKTNNEIEGLKLEDKLMAADGAAKIFGGSLSSVVGTLGVLGIESEVFGEFEEKAASAISRFRYQRCNRRFRSVYPSNEKKWYSCKTFWFYYQ